MGSFKFFWTTHKWTGIVIAVLLLMSATRGFLLLIKKDFDWIQPPTAIASQGTIQDFAPIQDVVATIIAQDHPDFTSPEDIDRIDTRPGKRLHKVRSRHHYTE
ncbi:MAG: PepSY domain-containing protein [Phycisphaerales bacterium]|nr:PepSY domain-containing protein [Phycisphaerales bacterium]